MTARVPRAWRATLYEADGIAVPLAPDPRHAALWRGRVAATACLLGRLHGAEAVFAGAWNPFSRRYPRRSNHRWLSRLRLAARRLVALEGMGRACRPRPWGEEHLLLRAPAARGAVLARRFRQDAILVLRRFGPARIVLLRERARVGQPR